MWCKVLPPEGSDEGALEAWLPPSGAPARQKTAGAPAPDPGARLAQLEWESEQRAREAYAAGLREGEAAGRARGAAEIKPAVDRMARSIEEMAGMRGRLRREAEEDMVRLAMAIARRVLRRELAVDPEALRGLALGALEKLQGSEISRVRAHPSQAALISSCLAASRGTRVDVVAEPGLEPGAVVFETTRGNLDASIDTQLGEIERGLADRLRRRS